ncbi:MAG TPA: FAD-dependent oxidoreductase [Verrucomicrobiae bacterium]|nr:FAD-dependent oxidoreductase [Verrucomicrobiae bacterium]
MSKHILIIGGGVAGLCTAYYCAQSGFKVTVVERKSPQRDGCSFGNAGMIVPSHFVPLAAPGAVSLALKWMWNPASPFYVKPRLDAELFSWGLKFWRAATTAHVRRSAPLLRDLALASRASFEEFAALPENEFGLVKKGLLMLCKTRHSLDEESKTAEQARALGIPVDILDAKQTAALDPGARLEIAGAAHFPLDCHFSPGRFMDKLQQRLETIPAVNFIWDSEVVGFRVENGRRISAIRISGDREVEADEFVLCSGAWSPELARQLGLKIPIQAGKGYSLTLTQPRQLPQICSILTEARVAVTPMDGTLRVGGTMEVAGLNEDINPVRVRGIVDSFCSYFPEFKAGDFAGVRPWRGLRPCSPDGLPLVGRTAKFSNFSTATGHAMLGMTLSPATGKLIAEILSGKKPSLDIALLSPDRYN